MRKFLTVLAALAAVSLGGCGYNATQTNEQSVTAAWSEVINQYQRRSDLIPNLMNTVKANSQQEKDVLLGVAQARASVGSVKVDASTVNDPAALKKFQDAQSQLGGALSRLIAVSEAYPTLKSDAVFQSFMTQLEGTENRIAVARNRFIKEVQNYNTTIRVFPNNIFAGWFGFKDKANFSVENEREISTAPKVDFNAK